jgi:hypothetical protein
MPFTADDFTRRLAMLLRNQPQGTVALLTDDVFAFLDGHTARYMLTDDETGAFDEEFELDDELWSDFASDLRGWLGDPRFARRDDEVSVWLTAAPCAMC